MLQETSTSSVFNVFGCKIIQHPPARGNSLSVHTFINDCADFYNSSVNKLSPEFQRLLIKAYIYYTSDYISAK